MSNGEMVWSFETANLKVQAIMFPCAEQTDLSWDDDGGSTREGLESGRLEAFNTLVRVVHKATGAELGADMLCGSIYERPLDFIRAHRDADPMNRNCTAMRNARGQNVVICHYFPGMVHEACAHARKALRNLKDIRVREEG